MVAYGDSYISLEQFKSRSSVGILDTTQDEAIQAALDAATEQVNIWTGRDFWKTPSTELRYFSPLGPVVEVGDIVSIASISVLTGYGVYSDPIESSSYYLMPRTGAPARKPYRSIVFLTSPIPYGSFQGVQVAGEFGWPVLPPPIVEATFLLANRERSLWTAPFGVTGNAEVGALESANSLTPQIKLLLAGYRVRTL